MGGVTNVVGRAQMSARFDTLRRYRLVARSNCYLAPREEMSMTPRTHHALGLTAIRESCSCCFTPSKLLHIEAAGRMPLEDHANQVAMDKTEGTK